MLRCSEPECRRRGGFFTVRGLTQHKNRKHYFKGVVWRSIG